MSLGDPCITGGCNPTRTHPRMTSRTRLVRRLRIQPLQLLSSAKGSLFLNAFGVDDVGFEAPFRGCL